MGLPAGKEQPVTEAERAAATRRLHELVAEGLQLDRFTTALEQVLVARDHDDLAAALSVLPPVIRLTPSSLRSPHPVEADAGTGVLKLGVGWQLGAESYVKSSTGVCEVDLTQATWDRPEVDLTLKTTTGVIKVVIPRGVAVQMRSTRGHVITKDLEQPLPGSPVLRVTAAATTGIIQLRHPAAPKNRKRRFRWRRRRSA